MDALGTTERKTITWERAATIFGHPKPPKSVWESQFDYCDDALERIARTPYDEFDLSDLWYYHHDLAYVELQPDLFAYLFPVCLMDWHKTLMQNAPCSHGDSEFHKGLYQGNVLAKMTSTEQQEAIFLFMRDSFLERLDSERDPSKSHGWLFRFNSVGIVTPRIDLLWDAWWRLETIGQAAAAIQYCSGLMYFDDENPLFPMWTTNAGGGGPYLWENDSHIFSAGWNAQNVEFLTSVLTAEFVQQKLPEAASRLAGEPESEIAAKMRDELPTRLDLVQERVRELPRLLADHRREGWTV